MRTRCSASSSRMVRWTASWARASLTSTFTRASGSACQHLAQGADAHARAAVGMGRAAVGGEAMAGVQPLQLGDGEVGDAAAAVGGAVYGGVVDDDAVAVAGGLDVDLQQVGAPPVDGAPKGGEGVLGRQRRSAAVGDEQRRARQVAVAGAGPAAQRKPGEPHAPPGARQASASSRSCSAGVRRYSRYSTRSISRAVMWRCHTTFCESAPASSSGRGLGEALAQEAEDLLDHVRVRAGGGQRVGRHAFPPAGPGCRPGIRGTPSR